MLESDDIVPAICKCARLGFGRTPYRYSES
jgi:hypothetical protein